VNAHPNYRYACAPHSNGDDCTDGGLCDEHDDFCIDGVCTDITFDCERRDSTVVYLGCQESMDVNNVSEITIELEIEHECPMDLEISFTWDYRSGSDN